MVAGWTGRGVRALIAVMAVKMRRKNERAGGCDAETRTPL